jgi:hypothetical protein
MQARRVEDCVVLQCRGEALSRETSGTDNQLRERIEYVLPPHLMIYNKCGWSRRASKETMLVLQ